MHILLELLFWAAIVGLVIAGLRSLLNSRRFRREEAEWDRSWGIKQEKIKHATKAAKGAISGGAKHMRSNDMRRRWTDPASRRKTASTPVTNPGKKRL